MRHLVLAACLATWTSGIATAAEVTLMPIRDNTLFEDANGDTSNGAGPVLFAGSNGQNLARRALFSFDVASQVPEGATIDSAVLALTVSNASNSTLRPFTLHRVLADWGEGISSATGGSGAPATNGDATWMHTFYPALQWSTPGGDFDAAVTASVLVGGVGVYVWRGAVLAADVEAWRAQPGTNHGWLLQGEEGIPNTARRFESREAAEPTDRPALTVYYSGKTAVRSLTWGSLKASYRR